MKYINGTKTLEVGDVWVEEDKKYNYRRMVWISLVKDDMVSGVTDEGRVQWCCSLEYFLLKNKFLYKSKASVKDLFCVKENAKNFTQTDLCKIDDMQYPPRHDKTAYELKIENNKLQAEINRLRDRNTELFNELNYIACGFCKTADEAIQHARKALNGES